MGANFVTAFVEGFTSGGAGLATGMVGFFDGLMKGAEGGLTSVAEVGAMMAGVALVIGVGTALFKRLAHRAAR